MQASRIGIKAFTCTSALGRGLQAHSDALLAARSGLRKNDYEDCALQTWIGRVAGVEQCPLPPKLQTWECRNNRLAWLALRQDGFLDNVADAVARYGADRVAVYMGTSTSGIRNTEQAYQQAAPKFEALAADFNYDHSHNTGSLAGFVSAALGLCGPGYVISTACSSSAKVFASAERAIKAGLCDAAVVGGVDSLCLTTLHGFNALQLVSSQPCRPADAERDGISIGEAGGFALLTADAEASPYALLGYGESSDAYHMSSPEPNGAGAAIAMRQALAQAGIERPDYINLHGTATPANDRAESRAIKQLFDDVPCSSTKGYSGHTLGAAGILEACIGLLALEHNQIWPSLNTRQLDPDIEINIVPELRAQPINYVLSNSFGFGGSNCSLLFGRGAPS